MKTPVSLEMLKAIIAKLKSLLQPKEGSERIKDIAADPQKPSAIIFVLEEGVTLIAQVSIAEDGRWCFTFGQHEIRISPEELFGKPN